MGINADQLGEQVVRPTLELCGNFSPAALQLLVGTAAAESELGDQLCDDHGGLGLYRISAEVHQRVWDDYLVHFPDQASLVRGMASQRQFLCNPHQELIYNLAYATAIAWFNYLRCGANLDGVDARDTNTLANIWWHYYHPTNPDGNLFLTRCPHMQAA
ncbi:hypothetical protein MIB92_08860 [Aestuariirhabdus sp. Z084]|uniref:hypothetical protein n=1 Tax=Aestuariirhabdus haliotis TaxID=2918751 RepID=UPI00201B3EA8|nr:hypothetical protein [Aestuariirhabdus haliotis]MCL6415760.1 hypothetical protein [Aestuariirhabdus haliotis]MCL6419677.1 hypothetical protein [Aestuariirhabdus haliotis]